jgi:hypothetical protein
MNKLIKGLFFGTIVGVIDVTPMVIMKLPLSADLSAFALWLAAGVLITYSSFPLNKVLKGIAVAFLVLLSPAVIIVSGNPFDLIIVCSMTLILGSFLGWMAG